MENRQEPHLDGTGRKKNVAEKAARIPRIEENKAAGGKKNIALNRGKKKGTARSARRKFSHPKTKKKKQSH